MVMLRDYQIEAVTAIRHDWQDVDRTLAIMATGTGKTVVFLALLDQLRQAGELRRALVIAHRRELIHQPIERAWQMYPDMAPAMGIVMADQNEVAAQIVVATVQSINASRRLEWMLQFGSFSHVIIDECHHATQGSYTSIIDKLPGVKVLGMTATPIRSDGDGLSKIFERVAYRLPINRAIERGALVPFDALGVGLPITFANLRRTRDGWDADDVGGLLSAGNILDIVFDKWREYAGDRQTIAFTANVAQAEQTAAHFQAQGVRAAWVSGETPKAERDQMLRDYQAGKIQVVANCMVLTEGFDAPETSAVLMLSPTRSDLTYVQKLGRGLRTAPGKTDCRVLDFVPTEDRNVIMAGDVLGKPCRVREAENKAEQAGLLVAISVDKLGTASSIDPNSLIVRVLNLLRKDLLAWSITDHYATAALSEDAMLAIVLPDPTRIETAEAMRRRGELFEAHEQLFDFIRSTRLYLVRKDGYAWHAELQGMYGSFEAAKGAANVIGEPMLDATLAGRKRDWRRESPTDKQIAYMRRIGVRPPAGCTKGMAAQLITQTLTLRATYSAERTLERQALRGEVVYA